MKNSLPAVLAALVLAAAGCSSGSSDERSPDRLSKAETAAAAKLATALADSSTDKFSGKEARCIATDFVGEVGVAKLTAAKVLTAAGEVDTSGAARFDAQTSGSFADALLGCVDYQERVAEETAKTDTTIDAAAFRECLEEKLPDSLVKKMLVAAQTASDDALAVGEEGNKAMTACKATAKKPAR